MNIKPNGIGDEIQPYFAETRFSLSVLSDTKQYSKSFDVFLEQNHDILDFVIKGKGKVTLFNVGSSFSYETGISVGLGQFSQLKDINIYYQVRCFAYVLITKSQMPQYSAYRLRNLHGLTYESNYAM